jgi:hypothetical protein
MSDLLVDGGELLQERFVGLRERASERAAVIAERSDAALLLSLERLQQPRTVGWVLRAAITDRVLSDQVGVGRTAPNAGPAVPRMRVRTSMARF